MFYTPAVVLPILAYKTTLDPMQWITRERPKIDRIACPWLLKNFVDPEAQFVFFPKEQVFTQAKALGAIPYDIPGAEYSHYGQECTFDYILYKHQLTDPALHQLAVIIRGAETNRFDLAPQAAVLWAISAGLSYMIVNDLEQLALGMKVYDALYAWAQYAQQEKHNWIL